ncbi:hypothetical protein [Trinickia symbiotica]|uniref:Uncharacterized protein n=1 Tax=Trinickia symbiotica TaxID=863227 RepID=A0A2N7X9P1_9BURK|nr:hypothetical protein [Trinickia symbiotica]PMS38469.1 hypothetical protein C0Z20_00865 [Trinickia symbiotica]
MQFLSNLFARLQEPSTHAALASLSAVGTSIAVANGADPHVIGQIGTAASAVFGLLGVFLSEGKGAAPAQQ